MAKKSKLFVAMITAGIVAGTNAYAEQSNYEIAKKLANTIASIISVNFQFNYDSNIGANEGDRYSVYVQPLIPFSLNDEWNIISRTYLPVVWQNDIFPGAGSQSGIGNSTQSIFFTPKEPTERGWIWGAGPVVQIPTASNDLIGGDQWGLGPTAVILKQDKRWTYGGLFNHIWSIAQDNNAPISSTFIQPVLAYSTNTGITYTLKAESTYNWESEEWSVPINANIAKVTKWVNQVVSYGGIVRYWVESPNGGPEGWGAHLMLTFVFPK